MFFLEGCGVGDVAGKLPQLFGVEDIVFGDLFLQEMAVELVGGFAYVAAGAIFEEYAYLLVVVVVGMVFENAGADKVAGVVVADIV